MFKIALSVALLATWCIFIFMMSAAAGPQSQSFSDGFSSALLKALDFLPFFDGNLDGSSAVGAMSFPIRKLAHFSEYVVLGFLAFNAVCRIESRRQGSVSWRSFLLAFAFCVLYAASDELHQFFVPGRAARVFDVLVDSSGGLTALAIVGFFRKARARRLPDGRES